MIFFQVGALLCGLALYLLMLGVSLHLAFRSPHDPDCRMAGIFLSLILIGAPMAVLGIAA